MPAKTPEEICRLFQRYMSEGDIESLFSLYDPDAVFLAESGEVKKGEDLRAVGQFSCREAPVRFQHQESDPVRRYRAYAY